MQAQIPERAVYLNQRRHPRQRVRWLGHLELGQSVVTGFVRDHSAGGICFEPGAGYVDGNLCSKYEILTMLVHDDHATVVCSGDRSTARTASIRWSGYSEAHACHAIGLEFQQ